MTVSLLIEFRDPARASINHPFSFQSVVRERWRPMARALGLPMLEDLGFLSITERADAEQLMAELAAAKAWLEADAVAPDRDYMIERIDQVVPLLAAAVGDWMVVAEISL